MMDDSLMAEFYGILLEGVTDGGQPRIKRLYQKYDNDFENKGEVERNLDQILTFIVEKFDDLLSSSSSISNSAHFLMLFAAVAHALAGIPPGDIGNEMPTRDRALTALDTAKEKLSYLDAVIAADEPQGDFRSFWRASKASTQRIASRRVRFPVFFRALVPKPLRAR